MTGATKFYKPVIAHLTRKEAMFAQRNFGEAYGQRTEMDNPDFDFIAPDNEYAIMTRRIALHSDGNSSGLDMGPFQITYNFSHAIRRNNFPMGHYGAPNISFRMLYEFLCEVYNGGYPFVDTYFDQVFKTRAVYEELRTIYETIQDDINQEQAAIFKTLPLKKDGTPDMRYKASKRFMDFKVWQDPIIKQDCKMLADAIRKDIKVCLSSGRLPLRGSENPVVSDRTREARARLGGMAHPDRLFFASGQLINHLNIYVEVGSAAA